MTTKSPDIAKWALKGKSSLLENHCSEAFEQHCLIEFFMMMETFHIMVYICALEDGSHEPHVATEHLKHGWCDCELNFFNLNVSSHMYYRQHVFRLN